MFKDMTISKEYIAQFREQKGSAEIAGVEFNVEVLTNGHWPNEGEPTCSIPPEMTRCRADFEQFYKHKRQAQNLNWLYHHGECTVRLTFCPKPYQLVTDVFQAAILSLFNQ